MPETDSVFANTIIQGSKAFSMRNSSQTHEICGLGIGVTLTLFALHLIFSKDRVFEAWTIPIAAMLGYTVDTAVTLLGALDFPTGSGWRLPAPLWIAALWLAFSTTINTSLAWLRHRPLAAFAVGAASGPIAYAGGAFFEVVSFPNSALSVTVLMVLWGAAIPVLISFAVRSSIPPDTPAATVLTSRTEGAA